MRSEWKISFSLLSPGLTYANSLGVNTLHALTCAMDVLSQGRRREDCPYDDSCGFSQTFLHTCALLPQSLSDSREHVRNADTYTCAVSICANCNGTAILRPVFSLTMLGSGSAGNSALVATGHCKILVDGGLSARQLV